MENLLKIGYMMSPLLSITIKFTFSGGSMVTPMMTKRCLKKMDLPKIVWSELTRASPMRAKTCFSCTVLVSEPTI